VTCKTLHCRFELALKECHNNGFIELLVLVPGQFCCSEVVKMVIVFLLVSLPVVSLDNRSLNAIAIH